MQKEMETITDKYEIGLDDEPYTDYELTFIKNHALMDGWAESMIQRARQENKENTIQKERDKRGMKDD